MCGGASEQGICFVEFVDRVKLGEELTSLCRELNATISEGENEHLRMLEQQLAEYFARSRKNFSLSLHLTGTDFQKSVWQCLMEIPYGRTWTYKEQAKKMNHVPGIRAIAATNGKNKHAIVIPCHRVIGSNGALTGYAAGLDKKSWLLKFERNEAETAPELDFA